MDTDLELSASYRTFVASASFARNQSASPGWFDRERGARESREWIRSNLSTEYTEADRDPNKLIRSEVPTKNTKDTNVRPQPTHRIGRSEFFWGSASLSAFVCFVHFVGR
jgi:hypothetical protein